MSSYLIKVMERRLAQIAFDANLYDLGWADYPYARNCSRERQRLIKLMKTLGPAGVKAAEAAQDRIIKKEQWTQPPLFKR